MQEITLLSRAFVLRSCMNVSFGKLWTLFLLVNYHHRLSFALDYGYPLIVGEVHVRSQYFLPRWDPCRDDLALHFWRGLRPLLLKLVNEGMYIVLCLCRYLRRLLRCLHECSLIMQFYLPLLWDLVERRLVRHVRLSHENIWTEYLWELFCGGTTPYQNVCGLLLMSLY